MDQPTLRPTNKVMAMSLTAAGVSVLLGLAKYAGVDMSIEFATGIVTLLSAAAGYWVRDRVA